MMSEVKKKTKKNALKIFVWKCWNCKDYISTGHVMSHNSLEWWTSTCAQWYCCTMTLCAFLFSQLPTLLVRPLSNITHFTLQAITSLLPSVTGHLCDPPLQLVCCCFSGLGAGVCVCVCMCVCVCVCVVCVSVFCEARDTATVEAVGGGI